MNITIKDIEKFIDNFTYHAITKFKNTPETDFNLKWCNNPNDHSIVDWIEKPLIDFNIQQIELNIVKNKTEIKNIIFMDGTSLENISIIKEYPILDKKDEILFS